MLNAFDPEILGRRSLPLARVLVAVAAAAAGYALFRLLTLLAFGPALPQAEPVQLEGVDPSAQSAQSVAAWHLFGNTQGPIDLAALAQAAPATALTLTLRGTLNENAPEGGIAIIADASGTDRAYRVGDLLPGDARLDGIYAGRVLLSRAGVNESLSLPRAGDGTPAPASGGGARTAPAGAARTSAFSARPAQPGLDPRPFVLPSIAPGMPSLDSIRDATGMDPAQLAKEVQIFPVIENGRMAGVRLSAGRDSDLLVRAGLHPNDLVTAVNGVPLDGPQRQAELMASFAGSRTVQLTVRRDGKEIQLSVSR